MNNGYEELPKDYKGMRLCVSCWNGNHYTQLFNNNNKKAGLSSNCKGGGCDCPCVDLMNNKPQKVVRDKSLQTEIDVEPIEIGPKS